MNNLIDDLIPTNDIKYKLFSLSNMVKKSNVFVCYIGYIQHVKSLL